MLVDALLTLLAVALALALRPWRATGAGGPPWPWLACCAVLPVFWGADRLAASAIIQPLSGASLLVLLAGWPLAVLALLPVAGVMVAVGGLPWDDALHRLVWLGLVPGTLAMLLGAGVRRWLPQHLFVYIMGRGFFTTWVAVAVAGALSRQLDHNGWVDTVYLGAWPRATFERFGGFDEQLVRNQDDEHNLRITRGGGRVWQSSRIKSVYRPRATLSQVFRQYLQYGYWKPFVMKKHGQAASLRHLVPGVFVLALGLAALLLPVFTWPLVALVGAYVTAVLAMTMAVARSKPLAWPVLWRVPDVIVAYHFGYGIGSLIGWWDALRGGAGRERFAKLTR